MNGWDIAVAALAHATRLVRGLGCAIAAIALQAGHAIVARDA